uniref:Uncharacterized protein n=1 Tax=Panagrolaimus superbus TaxID=310955 RepID=A0A914Y5Q4_9BILA
MDFMGVANTGKNYSEAVNFYCMGTVPESLKFPLCDCSHITAEYQKEDWQSYINYCRGVETKMRNVSIGLTTKTSILEVNHKKEQKAGSDSSSIYFCEYYETLRR